MDYLVFLTGLFLLTAGLGCIFYFREDHRLSRWPMLGAALIALGLKIWLGIPAFALGMGTVTSLIGALLGSAFAMLLLAFCLSPLAQGQRTPFIVKWASIVAFFAVTFIAGAGNTDSPGYTVPILVIAFIAGWRFPAFAGELFRARKPAPAPVTALLLTALAAFSLLPEIVEITFDVNGQGDFPARNGLLAALVAATACSLAFCLFLWSVIYQESRSALSANLLRRRKIGTVVILASAVFTVANGAWLAHWLGYQEQQERTSTLLSALHLGADSLDVNLIQQIKGFPEETESAAFASLRSELIQIHKALPRTRFCYILGLRNDKLVFLVDAENPSHSDTFSSPGDPVEDFPEKWQPELAGRSSFNGPDRDEWGVWFSAAVPILDPDRKLVALLGIDYPAAEWLRPLAARRLATMVVTLSVALLLIALFSFHLMSIRTAVRVENLTERLTDAMTAAEFDTWECFPKPFKLDVGERIASTLGWNRSTATITLRKVWRSIHPEDRVQLFNLIRQQGSSEAEVRLRDANGHWLWFMLRGRIVRSHFDDDTIRLVGTILNIDERHRSRLELDKQRRFSQHIMESVPNGLAVVSGDGLISYANPAFIRLARSGAAPLTGRPLDSLISGTGSACGAEGGRRRCSPAWMAPRWWSRLSARP